MNTKLLLKILFLIVVALLLVTMGMNNRQSVSLWMPPLLNKGQKLPAAMMYFGFFALGLLSGAILTAGAKRGGKSKTTK